MLGAACLPVGAALFVSKGAVVAFPSRIPLAFVLVRAPLVDPELRRVHPEFRRAPPAHSFVQRRPFHGKMVVESGPPEHIVRGLEMPKREFPVISES